MAKDKIINAVIIGASGYTGAELVRLLQYHTKVKITALVADSNAGQPIESLYPHLSATGLPGLVKLGAVNFTNVDVAFCCLPHATTQEVAATLPRHLKIIDLSADFRLKDTKSYEYWYETAHKAPVLQKEAIYGLTELFRNEIKKARFIACPGCYPTSATLPLFPLLKKKLIDPESIIIDAKSGITGAGRSAKVANLFAEINDSMKAYGIGHHRHMAEIDQSLSLAAERKVIVTFTPHVAPMNRGILSTIYVRMNKGVTVEALKKALTNAYKNEPFITVLHDNHAPSTREVAGTNKAVMNVFSDRSEGRAILVSVIDNLVKGASGQAIQNMNLIFGLPETDGLFHLAVFP